DGLQTGQSTELQARVKRALGNADFGVCRGHAAFGGGDVRPALEQFAGNSDRQGWRRHEPGAGLRQFKAGRGLAAQRRYGVEQFRSLELERGKLSFGRAKLRFGLGDVEVGGNAAFAAVRGELQRAAVGVDRVG